MRISIRAAIAAIGFLSCAIGAFAATTDVAPTGVLRATYLGSNPVQGHIDPATGQVSGVVADLTRELARRLGVSYEIYPAANAADIVARLDAGKSDIGFLAYDPQRAREVDFSDAYALMYNALVVRADSPIHATAEVDRPGTTVAAVRGQTQQIVLSANTRQGRMVVLDKKPTQAELEEMLEGGKIDVYGANRQDAEQMAAASHGKLRALPDNFLVVEQALATPHGQPLKMAALNGFVADVRGDGFVQQSLAGMHIAGLAVAGPPTVHDAPPGPFAVGSAAFKDGGALARKNAGNAKDNPNCIGDNVSPPLAWSNLPPGTKSLALTMVDPEGRSGLGVVHWVAYGIPPSVGGFAENEVSVASDKYVGGKGTNGLTHYTGPCTPANTGMHHYTFTLIATDLDPGALPPGLTRAELMDKLDGHAKGAAGLVGLFGRP